MNTKTQQAVEKPNIHTHTHSSAKGYSNSEVFFTVYNQPSHTLWQEKQLSSLLFFLKTPDANLAIKNNQISHQRRHSIKYHSELLQKEIKKPSETWVSRYGDTGQGRSHCEFEAFRSTYYTKTWRVSHRFLCVSFSPPLISLLVSEARKGICASLNLEPSLNLKGDWWLWVFKGNLLLSMRQ